LIGLVTSLRAILVSYVLNGPTFELCVFSIFSSVGDSISAIDCGLFLFVRLSGNFFPQFQFIPFHQIAWEAECRLIVVSQRGRLSDRDLPSRADEVDNWGSTKKFVPTPADSFDRRGPSRGGGGGFEDAPRRGGGGFDDAPGGISRADEVDNWGAAKKFVPTAPPPERRGGGGGGFESTYRDAGSEADRWSRREPPPATDDVVRPAERPRLVLKPRSVPQENPLPPLPVSDRNGENERPLSSHSTRSDRSLSVAGDETATDQPVVKPKPRSNPFGAARPREEVLAEKGQDWRKIDAELEVKRPSSSHSNRSSRPQTPEVAGGEGVPRSRPKVSPFGDARPRDVSAERVNKDWRKPAADVVVVDR
jgi:hypothetical protein